MIYTRSLHPDDYQELIPWTERLIAFEHEMSRRGLNVRKDHEHRLWEYAFILRGIEELLPGRTDLRILDTGSGGSYLPCILATIGHNVEVSDSMEYGEIEEVFLQSQRDRLGIRLPLIRCPVEQILAGDQIYDVTMCVSVIEHVDSSKYEQALRELYRVTKPGGFIFITSDYFRNDTHAAFSPYKSIQHNIMTLDKVLEIPSIIPVSFVGDLDLKYKGDFVNNYSFVNICLQKTTNPSTSASHSSGP